MATTKRGKNVAEKGGDRVKAVQRELDEERRARRGLVEASVRLNSLLSLPELLAATMKTASQLMNAETSSILVLDEGGKELTFAVATGKPGESVTEMRVPADQGIAGWVLKNGKAAVVNDVKKDRRFYAQIDRGSGFSTKSILAVPLRIRDRAIGVVEVINKKGGAGFTERDEETAGALAAQAAVAIENARLYQKLADAVVESRMSYRL
jgi:sigma-B regulation protein RsbU (phosphoserine phosphatase)